MGYTGAQMQEMKETIHRSPCETVVVATPAHLSRLIDFSRPCVHVSYSLQERGPLTLRSILHSFLATSALNCR